MVMVGTGRPGQRRPVVDGKDCGDQRGGAADP